MPQSHLRGGFRMAEEVDSKTLISPATTPSSVGEDIRFLVPSSSVAIRTPKKIWYKRYRPPYAMLIISIIELIVYLSITEGQHKLLRYDPNRQKEAWRFVTYMFLHNSVYHIILNIIIQCMFAMMLEKNQGSIRVGILYFGGGATGALGAGCLRPDLVVGASAGVYALLISHLSHIILNFDTTKNKLWTILAVIIIVLSDVGYSIVHAQNKDDPLISEGAHIAGAVSGFLLGLLLYKSNDKNAKSRNRLAFWFGFVMITVLICTLLFINFQIKRCTPLSSLKMSYVYLC